MSSRVRLAAGTAALISALVAFSCGGEPPNKEIQQARSAIEAARAQGADRWATEELTAAEDALKRSNQAVDDRDYRLALNHALDSLERAQNAAREAEAKKTAARTQAERGITTAATALNEATAKLKAAEGRVPAARLADPRSDLAMADQHVQEARSAFERGDWQASSASTASAMQSLTEANSVLDTLAAPPARRRR